MTKEEENAVNYVAGYVVRTVKDHAKDQCQLDILESLTGQNASCKQRQLTEVGLVHIYLRMRVDSSLLLNMQHGGT